MVTSCILAANSRSIWDNALDPARLGAQVSTASVFWVPVRSCVRIYRSRTDNGGQCLDGAWLDLSVGMGYYVLGSRYGDCLCNTGGV